jgi:hypothetical protein
MPSCFATRTTTTTAYWALTNRRLYAWLQSIYQYMMGPFLVITVPEQFHWLFKNLSRMNYID